MRRNNMKNKREQRHSRKLRIRSKVTGTKDRPRLAIFRSNTTLYVQVIDDGAEETVLAAKISGKTIAKAKELGVTVTQLLKKKSLTTIVFDRGGYRYHGVVKALADTLREGGIRV